jgi:hypothetical protein
MMNRMNLVSDSGKVIAMQRLSTMDYLHERIPSACPRRLV